MSIEYLERYQRELTVQRQTGELMTLLDEREQPNMPVGEGDDVRCRYSWAVPNDNALAVIARHSPNGVVEIGAGGGYWAMLLRERGVDVAAYDPEPDLSSWHSELWSPVSEGDHAAAAKHPERTLLLCWPSYAQAWTHEVIERYEGDTVVYIGEGPGGCTGTDRMHALLGDAPYCTCWVDDQPCTCDWPDPRFELVETVNIPQWFGLHDRLHVYRRCNPLKG